MHLDADSQREACGTLLGGKDDVFKVGGAVDRVLLCVWVRGVESITRALEQGICGDKLVLPCLPTRVWWLSLGTWQQLWRVREHEKANNHV